MGEQEEILTRKVFSWDFGRRGATQPDVVGRWTSKQALPSLLDALPSTAGLTLGAHKGLRLSAFLP